MNLKKIFIWNDDIAELDNWKGFSEEVGFVKPTGVSGNSIDEVLGVFLGDFYDLVLLDVLSGNSPETCFGLQVAKEIRRNDPLVPIILVTSSPSQVYKNLNLDELTVSGIYHNSVMSSGVFKDLAVRESINRWYSAYPEYVLVRRCTYLIEKAFEEAQDKEFMQQLVKCIRSLPFSHSVDSWHIQLEKDIAKLLRDSGLGHVRTAYQKIVGIFRKADPFYMAVKLGRRHMSHNVQVFLMGIVILLEVRSLKVSAIDALNKIRKQDNSNKALADSLLIWACISMTHDVGYLSQHMKTVSSEIAKIANSFKEVLLDNEAKDLIEPVISNWPETHHAEIGARLWMKYAPDINDPEAEFFSCIAQAIQRHDSSQETTLPDKVSPTPDMWAQFLAVLCDELQDWHRYRHETPPGNTEDNTIPWRLFVLEAFSVNNTDHADSVEISIGFALKDFDVFVRNRLGTISIDEVERKFDRVLDVLETNLYCQRDWEIKLSAEFISRNNELATRSIHLPTTN